MIEHANFELDESRNAIVLRRNFAAPLARLFDAWTLPRQISQWWDPAGKPLADCEVDLRVGGTFRFVNQGRADHPFTGTYLEISPPNRIVFDAMGAIGTIDISERDGGTEQIVTMACASAKQLQQFVQMGIADGTARSLANLGTYLET